MNFTKTTSVPFSQSEPQEKKKNSATPQIKSDHHYKYYVVQTLDNLPLFFNLTEITKLIIIEHNNWYNFTRFKRNITKIKHF